MKFAAAGLLLLSLAASVAYAAPPASLKTGVARRARGNWMTALPGDVRVTLVGVTSGASSQGAWWTPDGAPLAASPYPADTGAERSLQPSDYPLLGGKSGDRPYWFAFEITAPVSADVGVINANTLDPVVDGKRESVRVRVLAFAPAVRRFGSATLALSAAAWQTIARCGAEGGHFAGVDEQGKGYRFDVSVHILPIRVDSVPDGTVVRVEWTGHFDVSNPYQIRVFDREGRPMEQVVGGEVKPTNNYHVEFRPHGVDSPTLEMVKEIRVEVRPQQEVRFENVSLQPAPKRSAK